MINPVHISREDSNYRELIELGCYTEYKNRFCPEDIDKLYCLCDSDEELTTDELIDYLINLSARKGNVNIQASKIWYNPFADVINVSILY